MIKFNCPSCGAELMAEGKDRGHETSCEDCGTDTLVPLQGALEIGNIIDEHMILSEIGRGSMGKVFLAQHLLMGRNVALKTISPHLRGDEDSIQSFIHELQTAARLQHPNIVTVFNAGFRDQVYYITMQFIDGKDLNQVIAEKGPLTEKETLRVAKAVADALSYAWREHRMIHRDIKPENIRRNSRGEYIVMDFGLACAQDETKADQGMIIGSPDFISPEQALGSAAVDFRADMYSLGVTLLYVLSGRRPFKGEAMEVVRKHLDEELPKITDLNPGVKIHDGTQELIDRMTAKQPGDRFETWDAMLKAVDDLSEIWNTNTLRGLKIAEMAQLQQMQREAARMPENATSRAQTKIKVQVVSHGRKGYRGRRGRRAQDSGGNGALVVLLVVAGIFITVIIVFLTQ